MFAWTCKPTEINTRRNEKISKFRWRIIENTGNALRGDKVSGLTLDDLAEAKKSCGLDLVDLVSLLTSLRAQSEEYGDVCMRWAEWE
jgi:hypothetical protein